MDGGSQSSRAHVMIVGGGASGALMAAHLLGQTDADVTVSIVERDRILGCGIAYGTDDPNHLLNTRVSQMSAFPDDPDHFGRWLAAEGGAAAGGSFVDRGTYGRYLASLLAPWQEPAPGGQRLRHIHGECLRLAEGPGGIEALLDDGRTIRAGRAILATGHAVPLTPAAPLRGAWDFRPPSDAGAVVAIIGTGLSMVDHVSTLLAAGHGGPILCLSRRGLLPRDHAPSEPMAFQASQIPFGAPVSRVMHWLRAATRLAEARGGTWRDALDGLRPHVAAIWQSWTLAERARFLRHAAAWWEVHRHRMPPISAERIAKAQASGQLRILRAGFHGATLRLDGRAELRITARDAGESDALIADHVIDCRGIRRNPEDHAAAVIRDLLARGGARLDPLRLGLETTRSARILDRDGRPSDRLHAIGPAARGTLWEITAIPDIRSQTMELAKGIAGTIRKTAQ